MYYVIIISMMIAYAWNLRYNFLSSAFFLQFVLHVCALSILSINGINEAIFIVWKKHKKQGETHLDTAHLPFSFKINWGVFFFHFWVWGWNPLMCGFSLSIPPQHELLFCCTILFKKLKVDVFFLILIIVIFTYIWWTKGVNLLGIHACIIDWFWLSKSVLSGLLEFDPF